MKKLLKKISKILILFTIVFAFVIVVERPIYADVGFYSSYSGESSSSSHSSSSSSSSDSSSDSESSSGGRILEVIILIIILIPIIIVIDIILSKIDDINYKRRVIKEFNKYDETLKTRSQKVETYLKQRDSLFSVQEFNKFAKEVFIKLQNSWTAGNWEEIRPFESNELFEQHKNQLQSLINTNQTNVVEDIYILQCDTHKFEEKEDKEFLTVTLKATFKDYFIDNNTKKVVSGNSNKKVHMIYKLKFMRKAGVKTKKSEITIPTINCPNCGAQTKVTSSGKCEYCESIITTGKHGWVLCNLEGRRVY